MSLKGPIWQEATAGGLLLAGMASLCWLGSVLPLLVCVLLWVVLLVGLIIVLRRFWAWLLGPLFIYDLVRTARRNRLIPVICIYGVALLALVFILYGKWFDLRGDSWEELFSTQSLQRERLADFGSSMSALFFGMQFLAVLLLTPIYTAGAIVEEKERRTLDLLLVTPLKNREIVIGLLASRLATLGLVFLTALPILSLMEFLGGIDPHMVLALFLFTGFAMFCLANVCLTVSLYAKSTTRAIVEGYIYSIVLGAFWIAPLLTTRTSEELTRVAILIGAISIVVSAEIILFPLLRLRNVVKGSKPWPVPPGGYRAGEMTPNGPLVRYREVLPTNESVCDVERSPVTDSPIFWKEFASRSMPGSVVVYFLLCFGGFFLCAGILSSGIMGIMAPLAIATQVFYVGIVSSRMIAKERQDQTLDTLLMTSLEPKEILLGKWKASILRIRWPFLVLAGAFALEVSTDTLRPAAFICLILAALVYIVFFACLGLFISACCGTTVKAMLIFTVVFLAFGLGSTAFFVPLYNNAGFISWIDRVQFCFFSPLLTLQELTFDNPWASQNPDSIAAALAALGLTATAAWCLWKVTVFRFERLTGARAPWRHHPKRRHHKEAPAISVHHAG
jgi:ABC-type Na+ efflux pump permease subunit